MTKRETKAEAAQRRAKMVRAFTQNCRRRGESLEEWQARVDNETFRAQHKALWDEGVCI
jgi:hypothetical protein